MKMKFLKFAVVFLLGLVLLIPVIAQEESKNESPVEEPEKLEEKPKIRIDNSDEDMRTVIFDLSLFTPVEIFRARKKTIKGVHILLLYGSLDNMYGVPMGTGVEYARNDFRGVIFGLGHIVGNTGKGFQATMFNYTGKNFSGFQVGVIGNVVKTNLTGFQIGSLYNMTGNNAYGFQIGLGNITGRNFEGIQIGACNLIKRNFEGLQAGLGNIIRKDYQGVQIGVGNFIRKKAKAFQFGGINIIKKDFKGLQAGGLNYVRRWADGFFGGGVNIVGKNLKGIQVGGVNFVKWRTRGMQIGLINYANKIKGAQIGLINISKNMRGIPIGLINIILKGHLDVTVYSGLNTLMNIGIRSKSKYSYGIFTAGLDTRDDDIDKSFIGAGSGFHIPFNSFFVDFDLTYNTVSEKFNSDMFQRNEKRYGLVKARILPGWKASEKISVFAGPTFNLYPGNGYRKIDFKFDVNAGLNYTLF